MVTLNSRVQLTNLWPLNSRLNWNLEMLVFEEGGKPEDSEKKPGMRMRTDNKLNSHVMPSLGIKPGPHWWEATALTTAPSLLPQSVITSCDHHICDAGYR